VTSEARARKELYAQLARIDERLLEALDRGRAFDRSSLDAVRAAVSRVDLVHGGRSLGDATELAARWLAAWGLRTGSAKHLGYPNPSSLPSSVAGDALAAIFDPQCALWESAPAALAMERAALSTLSDAAGFAMDADACSFTTGASESLSIALAAAMVWAAPESASEGVFALGGRPKVYASREAHRSLLKCVRMLGWGERAVRECEAPGPTYALDCDAVARAIADDRSRGERPLAIVATAGTTVAGAIDPFGPLAALCEREGLWLHVDAAWAGGAALDSVARGWLDGIERARSIAWDAHKFPGLSLGSGMLFMRDAAVLAALFGVEAEYVASSRSIGQPYARSPQWSRRAIGAKVWLSLATEGVEGWARQFAQRAALGARLRDALRGEGWTLANSTPLPVVCARRDSLDRRALGALVRRAAREGVFVDVVTMTDGHPAIRAAIVSSRTTEAIVDQLVSALRPG
jgi:aromatic-L-amino-acid decarboxylase